MTIFYIKKNWGTSDSCRIISLKEFKEELYVNLLKGD